MQNFDNKSNCVFFLYVQFLFEFKIYVPIGFGSIELLRNGQIYCYSIKKDFFPYIQVYKRTK